MTVYVEADALESALPEILSSPTEVGTVELVVRRPVEGEREVLDEAVLNHEDGVVGDDWLARAGRRGKPPYPQTQVTLMNTRVIAAIAGEPERWPLAGDQLYVDLDLSVENLPTGTQLEVGSAVIEVSELPHTGCAKFSARFGSAAIRFVNAKPGRALRLRGMNARVVEPGVVRPGDSIRKLSEA